MSGVLSSVAGIAGQIGGGIVSALFGNVEIGGVLLDNFEIPESVTWGGTQDLVVHRLPGGAKVIDVMGAFDRTMPWQGIMYSADAADRARQMDALRQDGQAIEFLFADFVYTVVIRSFEADYKRTNWQGQYRIEVEVLPQDSGVPQSSVSEGGTSDIAGAQNSAQYGPPASSSNASVAAQATSAPVATTPTKVNVTNPAGKVSSYNFGSDFPVV